MALWRGAAECMTQRETIFLSGEAATEITAAMRFTRLILTPLNGRVSGGRVLIFLRWEDHAMKPIAMAIPLPGILMTDWNIFLQQISFGQWEEVFGAAAEAGAGPHGHLILTPKLGKEKATRLAPIREMFPL